MQSKAHMERGKEGCVHIERGEESGACIERGEEFVCA